jgi:hypothetical protein
LWQPASPSWEKLVTAIKSSASWKEGNNVILVMLDENDFSNSPNLVGMIVDAWDV